MTPVHAIREHYHVISKYIQSNQIASLRRLLSELSSVDIANSIVQLETEEQLVVLGNIEEEIASDVLAELSTHESLLENILDHLHVPDLVRLVERMDIDDATDVVSSMDEEKAEAVLEEMDTEDREDLIHLLQYDEETAGGIMTTAFVSIDQNFSVAQATKHIRELVEENEELEKFYTAYVIDEGSHLIGTVDVPKLLFAKEEMVIKDLMNSQVVAVDVNMDQEKVARIAQDYDLVVVPVIDQYLRLIGRITIDDLVDVIHEEYQEDIDHLAGTGGNDVLETSIIRATKDRLPWLFLALAGGILAALVMSNYEQNLSHLPQVTYFIPLIAALGGNIGIQSSSIVVRGLATGEISPRDIVGRVWKELRVGFVTGVACAILLSILSWQITSRLALGMTTGIALLIVMSIAAIVGSGVPMIMKRFNIDPALATGPFITTANDILGIFIYLNIVFYVLRMPLL